MSGLRARQSRPGAPREGGTPPRTELLDPVFVLVLVAGAALRFVRLGQQSFWYDEAHSVGMAYGLPEGSLLKTVTNIHGPLYLTALRGWMALFGDSEAAVRALSALLGILGIILTHKIAAQLLGRKRGLLAAAIIAFSPFHLWYSQEGRNYALLYDLGLIAVPVFLRETRTRSPGSFAAALAATVAACLANLSGFFLYALYWTYSLTGRRTARYPMRRLVLLCALSALVLWPWIARGARSTGELHLGRPERDAAAVVKGESPAGLLSIPYTFYNFSLGMTVGPSVEELKLGRFQSLVPHLWYLVPAGLLFAWLFLRGLARVPREHLRLLLLWTAVPVLSMAALSILNLKAPNSRYAFLAMAPYAMILSAGLAAHGRKIVEVLALACTFGLMGFSDYQYFTDSRYWKPDTRAAAGLVLREARPGDAVVVYALDFPVRFYLRGRLEYAKPTRKVFESERSMEEWLEKNTSGAARVWIVQCQAWWVDREDRFVELCRKLMVPRGEWRFAKAPVYLFEKPEAGEGAAPQELGREGEPPGGAGRGRRSDWQRPAFRPPSTTLTP